MPEHWNGRPLPEQHAIAAILDTIDAAIQQTDALIAKLRQMKAGLLHDLLTRGLDENGELRDPVAHPEQFKDVGAGADSEGVESYHYWRCTGGIWHCYAKRPLWKRTAQGGTNFFGNTIIRYR